MRKVSYLMSLLMLVSLALAQSPSGTVQGTVEDPQGASIAGASVTISNKATGAAKTVMSDSSGRYAMPFVPPGTYRIAVEVKGFRPTAEEDVVVEVSQTRVVNFKLSVGAATESVEVLATAPRSRYARPRAKVT